MLGSSVLSSLRSGSEVSHEPPSTPNLTTPTSSASQLGGVSEAKLKQLPMAVTKYQRYLNYKEVKFTSAYGLGSLSPCWFGKAALHGGGTWQRKWVTLW